MEDPTKVAKQVVLVVVVWCAEMSANISSAVLLRKMSVSARDVDSTQKDMVQGVSKLIRF